MVKKQIHPVLNHILKRKGKKVPVKDGRKIALVMPGGIMAGVRGGGTVVALKELGLSYAFDEIHTYSAGFCNASYFLAGNPEEGISIYYEELTGRKFLNFFTPWNMENLDYLIDCMKHKKPLSIANLKKSKTKLFAYVMNASKNIGESIYTGKFLTDAYFDLIRAAVSFPFLHPTAVKVGRFKFRDILTDKDCIDFLLPILHRKDLTDILIIYNTHEQHMDMHKHMGLVIKDERVFEIIPNRRWRLSRLNTEKRALKNAALKMGRLVKSIFGFDEDIKLYFTSPRSKTTRLQTVKNRA